MEGLLARERSDKIGMATYQAIQALPAVTMILVIRKHVIQVERYRWSLL